MCVLYVNCVHFTPVRACPFYRLICYQVAPAELEGLLLGHPQVADCAVVGVPDIEAGELPRAYIVLKAGQCATVKQIHDFMAGSNPELLFKLCVCYCFVINSRRY